MKLNAESRSQKVAVGVFGGSGYIGAELLRYLAVHPRVEIRWVTANRRSGRRIDETLPNLSQLIDGPFLSAAEGESRLGEVNAVFVALPHNQSQLLVPRLADAHPGVLFVDMAGDFRTNDPSGYAVFYGQEHAASNWLPRFVYGFTEYQREKLRNARLVANPGCFASGMLLALAPLAAAGKLEGDVCLTGITGSSGSGDKPKQTTHHPERAANVRSYKTLAHQHTLEVMAFLRTLTTREFRLQFVPQSGPFVRGIFTTVFVPGSSASELEKLYRQAYDGEALVSVVSGSPELRWVQGTPRSVVGCAGSGTDGVVFTVIDNLGKGGAGQALQNLNEIFGFPATAGLLWPGGYV